MANLYIMSGVPGSGKSTFARQLAGETGIVLSTDNIREQLTGSADDLSQDSAVWAAVYSGLDHRLPDHDYSRCHKSI